MSARGTALVSGVNRHPLTEQLEGTSLFIFLHNIKFLYHFVLWHVYFEKLISDLCSPLSSGGCLHQRENRLRVTVKRRGRGMSHWRPWWRPWSRWRTPKPPRDVFCPRTAAVRPVCLEILLNKTAFEVGIDWMVSKYLLQCFGECTVNCVAFFETVVSYTTNN